MKKKNRTKSDQRITETANISEERLVEIYSEAYYRALKRLECEKCAELRNTTNKKKRRWWYSILFILNVLLWPFKINKHFTYNKRIHEDLLTLIISMILTIVGSAMWFLGIVGLIYGWRNLHDFGLSVVSFFIICVILILMGSIFILAGTTFGEERDSNKIYAFSACVLALVSCILSLVSIVKS